MQWSAIKAHNAFMIYRYTRAAEFVALKRDLYDQSLKCILIHKPFSFLIHRHL